MEEEGVLESIREHAQSAKTDRALHAIKRRREGFFNEAGCSLEDKRKEIFQRFPAARVLRVFEYGLTLEAVPMKRVPEPPEGYAYKGGAARLALLHALGIESSKRSARDLDLIRVSAETDEIDAAVAEKIMHEDAKHGAGVEAVGSFEEYLQTRDITINEVLYLKSRIVCSHKAIEDITGKVLRPTSFALTQSEESKNRISAKILRFAAEGALAGNPPAEVFFPTTERLLLFSFLLQLERALSQRGRLADSYVREVAKYGLMPTEFAQVKNLQELSSQIGTVPQKQLKKFPETSKLIKKTPANNNRKKGAFRR